MTDCDVNKSRTINPSGSAAPGVQRDGTCDSLPSDGSSCCIVNSWIKRGSDREEGTEEVRQSVTQSDKQTVTENQRVQVLTH